MSAAAGTLRAPVAQAATPQVEARVDSRLLRLAAFAALAAFATAHWGTLVENPPVGRLMADVAVAVAAGATLLVIGSSGLPALWRGALAAVVGFVTVAAGLVITGMPARYLLPGNRHELSDNLDRGLGGIRTVDWPYGGDEDWLRLAVLLGAPLLLGIAATLAFWPARRFAGLLRGIALVLLLLLYGVAATENQPSVPLLRGLVLLVLVAAWLWLPRLSRREAVPAVCLVLAVGVVSLPLAARFNADRPWWDYQAWNWFGSKVVSFDWEHSYGPLDWPRDGTTLMNVKSDRAHYWKVETLDSFDGFRWLRSEQNDFSRSTTDIPDPIDERWDERIRFTIRALRSEFIVGAGVTYQVDGIDQTATASDGTTRSLNDPLERGDSYEISAYAPNPSARAMRAAEPDTALTLLQDTSFFLPQPGESALEGSGSIVNEAVASDVGRDQVTMGLRDLDPAPPRATAERLLDSPYGDLYRLTRRLTAGAPTTYDAVKRVETYLQRNLGYDERPPSQEVPLAAFVFEDKIGYCQQFSGAMALMLRMVGIPARVSTGFSPGSPNRETGEYRVRDLDAHSWVEVHFADIGWVPFDPTPAAAPPELQSSGTLATSAASGDAGEGLRGRQAEPPDRSAGAGGGDQADGGIPTWVLPLGLATLGLLAILARLGNRTRRRVQLAPEQVVDAQVRELQHALPRLGWRFSAGTTLLGLERRLARAAGPGAAAYVASLRAHRFSPGSPRAPGRAERRLLRRDLTAAGGPLDRLRGYLALPPLGPRGRDS